MSDGDAFHLDEPCGAADGGEGDDGWYVGVARLEHLVDEGVVGGVAKVDDVVHDVVEGHVGFGEEGFDVFPHAMGLLAYVADVEDLALVVDAGGAGDEGVGAIAVFDADAAFEGDAVLVGGVEVGGGVEVVLLLLAVGGACDGVGAHLYDGVGVGGEALDACGGEVVGVLGEALGGEVVLAGLDEAVVLGVDVADEEPCAEAVALEGGTELAEGGGVGLEDVAGLLVAVAVGVVDVHLPEVVVAVVAGDDGVVAGGDGGAALEVHPDGYLAAVEGLLLDVGLGDVGLVAQVGLLVGAVAEEVALEDVLGALVLGLGGELVFDGVEALELLGKGLVAGLDVEDDVVFVDAVGGLVVAGLGGDALLGIVFLAEVHCRRFFACLGVQSYYYVLIKTSFVGANWYFLLVVGVLLCYIFVTLRAIII